MIEIKDISKRFGAVQALCGVSLRLEEGHIYGLLGNNGAGKTTLLNILTNRLYADFGEITMDGLHVPDNDSALGRMFMLGEANLYPEDMRVERAIRNTALFYPNFNMAYAKDLAARFGLKMRSKIKTLSTGYRSIFRIVLSLSTNAPYLLLDEPVLGLDAQHRDLFYKLLLEKFNETNCCVLLSTHLIGEAARLVDHSIIIRDGRIIKNAETETLLAGCYTISGPAGAVDTYLAGREVLSVSALGGLKTAAVAGVPGDMPPGLELGRIELQDYFIALMNKEAKNGCAL